MSKTQTISNAILALFLAATVAHSQEAAAPAAEHLVESPVVEAAVAEAVEAVRELAPPPAPPWTSS